MPGAPKKKKKAVPKAGSSEALAIQVDSDSDVMEVDAKGKPKKKGIKRKLDVGAGEQPKPKKKKGAPKKKKGAAAAEAAAEVEAAVPGMRAREWVFTLNNPPIIAGDYELYCRELWGRMHNERSDARRAVMSIERGMEAGTLHVQGVVVFDQPKRNAAVQKFARGYWAKRKGTQEQAEDYVCKRGEYVEEPGQETTVSGPYEYGRPIKGGKGRRNDLVEVQAAIDSGLPWRQIAKEHFGSFVRYHRGLMAYALTTAESRDFQTTVVVYWGEPGVGKSRRAQEEAGPHAYWLPRPNQKDGALWWDGYDPRVHDTVVIDEFHSSWGMSRTNMLGIIDRYPFLQVRQRLFGPRPPVCGMSTTTVPSTTQQTKGGTVNFRAHRVIITSNQAPEDWWPHIGLGPMERRLQVPEVAKRCVSILHPLVQSPIGAVVHMMPPISSPKLRDATALPTTLASRGLCGGLTSTMRLLELRRPSAISVPSPAMVRVGASASARTPQLVSGVTGAFGALLGYCGCACRRPPRSRSAPNQPGPSACRQVPARA